MIKELFIFEKKFKLYFIKLHLISPDNEKPASINYITWERFYCLSIHINNTLKALIQVN